jgi:transposase
MAIVFQPDTRFGITYAYESISTWDKEKKQSRSKRTLIGRLDEKTGMIIPTDGRMKKPKVPKPSAKNKPPAQCARRFFGATYLLDAIGDRLGLTGDLRQCFPEMHKQMLSLVYYLILEDKNPLYRFEKWGLTHKHPHGKDISSQRSSEIFTEITEDAVQQFFQLQGRRRLEREHWVYDTTSISSYSETLKQVRYGHNKENDALPQFNLALVFGEQSRLPFYYRKLAGNIPDVKTVKKLLADLEILGLDKVKLVMDRGFFSADNVNGLLREHLKFLVAVKTSLKFVRKELDAVYDDIQTFEHYSEEYQLYSMSVPCEWGYRQERPYKGDVLEEKRRVYMHLYYNIDRSVEDQKNFDRKLMTLKNELITGKRDPSHENLYKKYFTVKSTPIRGVQVTVKEEAVKDAKRYYGFFAFLSNEKMDSLTALKLYRNKDVVEKAFGNLKERLNMRRTLVSSEQSLNGKLFVEFVALIYLSYLNKQMQDAHLYKDYTMSSMLDKLDVIECFESPGRKLQIGEMLDEQRNIYLAFGIKLPTSL